ncbi:hypothetical protein VB620_09215 [Nodularia harveyana UHCC-0300]|uniref:Uncharacterized protein n=1 Tax=Nodularia harveyana UHCC-0300 TaxID=2974287 RepID=A0ABU5UDQ8_9CYAN|nr:hypothetical protein [Nodularia harveyana]MEA5581518.1 hypothetical protein [Nodularia harveyana UHCC-0300]
MTSFSNAASLEGDLQETRQKEKVNFYEYIDFTFYLSQKLPGSFVKAGEQG